MNEFGGGWFGWVGMSKEEKRKKGKKMGKRPIYMPTLAYDRTVTRQKQREAEGTEWNGEKKFIFPQRQKSERHRERSLLKFHTPPGLA